MRKVQDNPAEVEYEDTGCDWHPSCLTCPFIMCKYDMTRGRDTKILIAAALNRGVKDVDALARLSGVSKRSVYRVLKAL